MRNTDRKELFETMPVPKAVLSLAIPTIVAMLITIVYNLADTYYVGYLNDADQTAAVTLSGNVTLLFIAICNLFGSGGASLLGRSLGRKDDETARRCTAFCIWGAILSGFLFSLLYTLFASSILPAIGADDGNIGITEGYLLYACTLGAIPSILSMVLSFLIRTEGFALQATIGTMSGCLLNIVLDPFFVLPRFLGLGAPGAGLATLVGNLVACLYLVGNTWRRRKSTHISLSPKMAIPDARIVREVCVVGIPAAIQNMLNVTGMAVLNRFTSSYGSFAVSAMGIAYKITMMPLYMAMAIGQGTTPIISYCYGSRDFRRIRETVRFSGILETLLMVLCALLEFLFASSLMRLFIHLDPVVRYGALFIREMCLGAPFVAFDFLGIGIFQAIGRGGLCLGFAIARKVVLEIPLLFLMEALFHLSGLGMASTLTELILSVATILILRSVYRSFEKI